MADLTFKTTLFFSKSDSGLTSIAAIAANADFIFTGRNQQNDNGFWTDLADEGFDNHNKLAHYGKFDNGDDPDAIFRPGDPTGGLPRKNTIAFEEDEDMLNVLNNVLAADSSTWVLRYLTTDVTKGWVAGEPVVSQSGAVNKYVHMDFSVASYRTHFKTRFEGYFNALDADERPGYIWLDNGRDNPMFTGTTIVPTEQYPSADGSDWFAASLEWIQWLIDNVCIPNGIGLCINFQSTGSAVTRFKQYIDVMSSLVDADLPARTFIEFFASNQHGEYETTLNLWKKSIEKMAYAESRGVIVDADVQLQGDLVQDESDPDINERARFTMASFLLAMGNRSTLRYSDDDNDNGVDYDYFNIPPLFAEVASIRQPVGKYYSTGTGVYRRDFIDGGYVICNYSTPSAPTYQIVPGEGTTKAPLVTQLATDLAGAVDNDKVWQIFAEPQDGGVLSYTLQSGELPPGRALNSSTGRITGTYTEGGIYSGVIRVSESDGGTVDVPFTFNVTGESSGGGDEPEEGALILGLNFGGTLQTMASGDVFQAAGIAATPVGYTLTAANATTDGTNLATLIRDASIPADWTDTLFQSHWNDAANPAAVVTIPASVPVTIKLGFNSGGTPAGRVVEPFFNGVSSGMAINFADYAANTGFVVTFENIAPVGGNITIEVCRHATATVSSRVMVGQVREYIAPNEAPVLNPIGNKTVNENEELEFTVTATDAEGTPTITYTALPIGMEVSGTDASKTFTWIPGYGDSGEYTVQFTATDDADATASETITITVNNIDPVPVLDSIGDKTVSEGAALTFTAVATIADETPPLYSGTGSAFDNGATIDPNTGEFEWTPTVADESPYEAVIVVTNPNDESKFDSETISITVNAAPEDEPVRPRWKRMPPIAIRVARTRRRRR